MSSQFQPVLAAALARGLLDPTEMTARFVSAVTGQDVTNDQVDDQLLTALDFIDDALWCARTAAELGLGELRLKAGPGTAAIHVRLDVRGIADPLLDLRVPVLALAVLRYRGPGGIAIFGSDTGWRLALVADETIAYKASMGATILESIMAFSEDLLVSLVTASGVLADLFPAEQEEVA